jgi:hypothetical protein
MRGFALLLMAAVCLAAPDGKKQKKEKAPDLEILEVSAHRMENVIRMDGRVKNVSEKPINGLVLSFDFLESGGRVITTQTALLDEETLDPEKEAGFHVQLTDPVRAVEFQIGATDDGGRILRVVKPGPFAIE